MHVILDCVVIPVLGVCLVHSLVNMRLFRRLRALEPKDCMNLDVSVLVPARNEERRIRECLNSLIAQKPLIQEIIHLDDRSEDSTASIAFELGFREEEGSRLRLIRGEELPEGWVGKNWACHQLSHAAAKKSSYLLFTDADTIHGPGCVNTAIEYARLVRSDLLSLWPRQITGTWSEKMVIPLGYLLFMAFQPLPLLTWLQSCPHRVTRWGLTRSFLASLGAANGQFLLFRRDAYFSLGGHEAMKDHLVEDIAFGRMVAAATGTGMRLVNADGMDLLQCRMYYGFAGLWEGFSKNLRPVFEESFLRFLLFGIVIGGLFLMPFCLLGIGRQSSSAALSAVLLIFAIRLLLTLRFRTSWVGFWLHPFAIGLALLMAMNSWRLCLAREIRWKGRRYSGSTRSPI